MAAKNCSMEEIGKAYGVDVTRRTLQRRYVAVVEKGRAKGKISLKRKMFKLAMQGNVTMCIWLSKNMLGYSDKVENLNTDKTFLVKDLDGKPQMSLVDESDFYQKNVKKEDLK